MIEYEVTEDGILKLKNNSDSTVKVWSIDFKFKSESLRLEKGKEKRGTIHVTDTITLKKELPSKDVLSVNLGIPRERIVEVTIYYSYKGRYYSLTLNVA